MTAEAAEPTIKAWTGRRRARGCAAAPSGSLPAGGRRREVKDDPVAGAEAGCLILEAASCMGGTMRMLPPPGPRLCTAPL